mgnify:CR=1 FL=1
MSKYIPKIGLEIHLELNTETKMFCACPNDPDELHPNINICPICTGHPGTLPVVNKKAIEYAIKLAKALNCKINKTSYFARKNYFYPDLPKGYQISQYELPISENGYLEFYLDDEKKKVRIRRAHLEEDTGKIVHENNYSLIDFNRAGVPLLEIVTEPDIRSAEEAKKFVEELILLVRYLGISEANPEKGQIRFEANISLGIEDELGVKVEVKNLGSIRSLKDAIEYEIKRQKEILENGGNIIQETRGFDEDKRITFSQRTKESAEDYRYFPEPDLPQLLLDEEFINSIQTPELPLDKRERFMKEYNLSLKEVNILVENKELADFFEETISEIKSEEIDYDIKFVYNVLANDILGLLEKYQKNLDDLDFSPYQFSKLLIKLKNKEINIRILKDILNLVIERNENIDVLLGQIRMIDEEKVRGIIEEIIRENQKAVEDYKKGKENALQFLIGALMRKTKGQIDINTAKEILINYIKEL